MTTGTLRSHDHSGLTAFPEYLEARRAINALATALDRDDHPMNRDLFNEAVADMASTSYAPDYCPCCATDLDVDPACWPHAADVSDGWMVGTYRCPRTGRTWTCGWATPDRLPH